MVHVVVDPIRQAGEAIKHTGEEYPGWVQAHHPDEPCKSPSTVLFIYLFFTFFAVELIYRIVVIYLTNQYSIHFKQI